MIEECEVQDCEKPVNKDGVCFIHKLKSISFGTIPGGAKDQRTNISHGREVERGLDRFRERKKAGENPSGTTMEAHRKDSYRKSLWEKHEKELTETNDPNTVKKVKRSLVNKDD